MLNERMDTAKADAQEVELRDTAKQFVGLAFYFPMLQQMRQDPFRTELFHGGFAEDAFANQMDQTLADEMSSRDSSGLVDAIVGHYTREASHG
jgi:Rod binding domain-containing protein